MTVCRECGRLPMPENVLDGEGYHEHGCTVPTVAIPFCLGCGYMPWDCPCELGPWFEMGPLTEDDYADRLRRMEGP